jgi:hypothetical protein
MPTFEDREKAFEGKFKHDQELAFKINVRRNKLLGLWAAKEMGLSGADAEKYAKEVAMADMEKPGDDDVLHKVLNDLNAKGLKFTEHRLRAEMASLLAEARKQMTPQ